MFVKFEIEKRREYWLPAGLSSLLSGILAYVWGVKPMMSAVIGILLLAVLTVRLHFDADSPWWATAAIGAVFSFIIYTEAQYAVGTTIGNVSFVKMLVNWAFLLGLVYLITAACGHIRYALVAVQALVILLGVANHMVVQTRGMEMQFTDLFSIGTAVSVAGDYTYTLSARTVGAIFFALISTLFLFLNRMPKLSPLKIRIGGLATGATALVLTVLLITTSWGSDLIGYQQRFWKIQSTTQNGFLVSFIHSLTAAKVSRPNGYSRDTLEDLLKEYIDRLENEKPPVTTQPGTDDPLPPKTEGDAETAENRPNIIVIMNETFSDLSSVASYLGSELKTDTALLPYFSSLSDDAPNIAKGYAMASVFGGNTANSEFEFLTGNSMAFLPANTVAYNLYLNKDNAFSVVDIMNKCGYHTVGMHPEVSSNWNRGVLYDYFGFDEQYFLESGKDGAVKTFVSDVPLTADDYYRDHVSDSTVYQRIIELYEQKEEGTPLFTFAITMQNHSGYSSSNFDYTVQIEGTGDYSQANEYLSSVQNSDAALQELITYFEGQEEDTLIVFFGDHQPSLPSDFYSEYFGVDDHSPTEQFQSKYVVPYLYWGNFDFECELGELTSLNYLSSHMLEIAGLPKTEFLKFTDMVEQEIIAINSYGWWDQDCVFHSFAKEDSDEISLLRLYKYLQYNALFDKVNDKLSSWFVLPDEEEVLTTKASVAEDAA